MTIPVELRIGILQTAEILKFAVLAMSKHVMDASKQQDEYGDSSREKNAAWCTVDFDNRVFRVRVVHVGRG